VEEDLMLTGDRPLWGFSCIENIEFYWDQWMRCTIACHHGRYSGVSDSARDAMNQSLQRAILEFRKVENRHEFDW
jgi:hypothetical protein